LVAHHLRIDVAVARPSVRPDLDGRGHGFAVSVHDEDLEAHRGPERDVAQIAAFAGPQLEHLLVLRLAAEDLELVASRHDAHELDAAVGAGGHARLILPAVRQCRAA
jgi:hypothetical protein